MAQHPLLLTKKTRENGFCVGRQRNSSSSILYIISTPLLEAADISSVCTAQLEISTTLALAQKKILQA
jgi:hypothetical protein